MATLARTRAFPVRELAPVKDEWLADIEPADVEAVEARVEAVVPRGPLREAVASFLLSALAPALAVATWVAYNALLVAIIPLPWGGTVPNAGAFSLQGTFASLLLAAGWITSEASALLALRRAVRALRTLPPFPQGQAAFRLTSLGLALGGIYTLIWLCASAYLVVFLLTFQPGR